MTDRVCTPDECMETADAMKAHATHALVYNDPYQAWRMFHWVAMWSAVGGDRQGVERAQEARKMLYQNHAAQFPR